MKKIYLLILMLFLSIKSFSQNTEIPIIESAIGLSQPQLVTYLRGILKGGEPKLAEHTDKIAYVIENEYSHIEYYITDDSCLSAGVHFKNPVSYKNAEDEITSTCPSKAKNIYFKISVNKRIIYYTLSDEELVIIALDKSLTRK